VTETQSSYRQIFKATSLFGGVQVFNILIGIVRVKFVAVLLGTAGVGILGLLNAPLNLILSITGLGIAFSAIRDVSEAHGTDDQKRIAIVIKTLRRWSWFTGLLGAVVTVSLAPLLSQWTFGNHKYTWAFVWLSVTLLLQAISKGQSAILQGTRRLKDMAKAGVIGSALGLFISIPLYYWYGVKGIVPAILITTATGLLLSWHFSRRVVVEKIELTFKETFTSGLGMAKLGIFMTIVGFLTTFSAYILNAFISNRGGVDQVGLYNAGWGVVGQYTGIIFSAMATDYYPRLSAINNDIEKVKELVRQQAETAVLIMTPLLTLLVITMPFVIRILYTPAFLPVIMFANLTILGMPFMAVTWAMGYTFLAKGHGSLFLTIEFIPSIVALINNLAGYYFWGLNGLGYSFILNYIIGYTITYMIVKSRYKVSFPISFYKVFITSLAFCLFSFISVTLLTSYYKYIASITSFCLASIFAIVVLNKRMDIKIIINKIVTKLKGDA
jgi:O-antigen/teichoic acid export membrane protein